MRVGFRNTVDDEINSNVDIAYSSIENIIIF